VKWKRGTADLRWRITHSGRSHTGIVVRGHIWGCRAEGVYFREQMLDALVRGADVSVLNARSCKAHVLAVVLCMCCVPTNGVER
jgi:hypothetical protein